MVEVFDLVGDQPGGDRLILLRGECGVGDLGDLGIEDPPAQLLIPDGSGVADGVQAPSAMAVITSAPR